MSSSPTPYVTVSAQYASFIGVRSLPCSSYMYSFSFVSPYFHRSQPGHSVSGSLKL